MTTRLSGTVHKTVQQLWRDLLSIYYANTATWRWLKSGALVFLGFFAWTGGAVLLSVESSWGFLTYVMAYGFLLVLWGPLTHLFVVPMTIRLRRTATHPAARWLSRNSGKVNLTIFFTIVIILGTVTPSIMMLEFSPSFGEDADVSGELVCNSSEDVVTCQIEDPEGIDRVEVRSGGETIKTVDGPPFEWELQRDEIEDTRTGKEFTVVYFADGEIAYRQAEQVDSVDVFTSE